MEDTTYTVTVNDDCDHPLNRSYQSKNEALAYLRELDTRETVNNLGITGLEVWNESNGHAVVIVSYQE